MGERGQGDEIGGGGTLVDKVAGDVREGAEGIGSAGAEALREVDRSKRSLDHNGRGANKRASTQTTELKLPTMVVIAEVLPWR